MKLTTALRFVRYQLKICASVWQRILQCDIKENDMSSAPSLTLGLFFSRFCRGWSWSYDI